MLNYDRLNDLIKKSGIKKAAICERLGRNYYYLRDAQKTNANISDKDLAIIASILHTTPEYLRDETDDPAPADDKKEKPGARSAEPESPLDNQLFDILPHLNEAQKRFLLDQAELLYERQQAKASDSRR